MVLTQHTSFYKTNRPWIYWDQVEIDLSHLKSGLTIGLSYATYFDHRLYRPSTFLHLGFGFGWPLCAFTNYIYLLIFKFSLGFNPSITIMKVEGSTPHSKKWEGMYHLSLYSWVSIGLKIIASTFPSRQRSGGQTYWLDGNVHPLSSIDRGWQFTQHGDRILITHSLHASQYWVLRVLLSRKANAQQAKLGDKMLKWTFTSAVASSMFSSIKL